MLLVIRRAWLLRPGLGLSQQKVTSAGQFITLGIDFAMPERGIRSTYSQSPCQILTYDAGGILSAASGFFFSTPDDRTCLITNRHVVTGLDNFTGRHLNSTHARVPIRIGVKLSSYL